MNEPEAEQDWPQCLTLWQCIGCGAMGSADECRGTCAFRKLELVTAQQHADLLENYLAATEQTGRLRTLVREIAAGSENGAHFERAYPGLQKRARELLQLVRQDEIHAARADERATVWLCTSCGQVEAPQECLGVCIRRNGEFVRSEDHDATAAQADAAQREAHDLISLLRQLAWATPRSGQWERTRQSFRSRAVALTLAVEPTVQTSIAAR
jgi:hypothetical protein